MKNRIDRAVRILTAFFAALLCLSLLTDFGRNVRAEPSEQGGNPSDVTVQMRVGPPGTAWEELDEGAEERPCVIAEGDEIVYCARQCAPEGELGKYELRMVLDECFLFESGDAWAEGEDGDAVSDLFDIAKKGQQLIFTAKESALDGDIAGRQFTFCAPIRGQGHIGERHLQSDECSYRIASGVNVFWRENDGIERWCSGEDVWVRGEIEAELMVEQQTVSDCRPGEIVDWSVSVRQLREDSYAVGVAVEDAALPEGLTFLGMAASGSAEGIQLERMGKNGWKMACPRLEYGQTVVVAFQCRVDAGCSTGSLRNTVTARAKNFQNIKTGTPRAAGDTDSLWVNGLRPSDTDAAPDR